MGWQLSGSGLKRTDGMFLYTCCAVIHIGNYRTNQEDNFFVGELLTEEERGRMSQTTQRYVRKSLTSDNSRNRIFAVSDGMGGHRDGEIASYMAADALRQFTIEDQSKAFRRPKDKFAYIRDFQYMIRQTNRKMLTYSEKDGGEDAMGATLSGLIAFADEIVPFNIGDSVVFIYEGGRLRKLTVNDNEAAKFGENSGAAMIAGGRRLTKYFGLPESGGMLTAAMSKPIPICSGQMYLICSDGLTDSLSDREIEAVFSDCGNDASKTADRLMERALSAEGGGQDNITTVVVKIHKFTK